MDTPLSGERIAEEKAFARRYLDTIAARKVEYTPDYAPPLGDRPRKVPPVNAPVVAPPDMDVDEEAPKGEYICVSSLTADANVNLTVKSIKPPLTLSLSASLTDSVTDLKDLVAKQSGAPAADAQRLLLKGKALADAKLLKEYDLADGAVITLMIKPGATSAAAAPAPAPVQTTPIKTPTPSRGGAPHLTITTPVEGASPSEIPDGLDFDRSPECPSPVSSKAFHTTAASPEFWQKVHDLCHSEFSQELDADTVFDTFLISMQGRLSASEFAKIRDVVGVTGEYNKLCVWRTACTAWRQETADRQEWAVEHDLRVDGYCTVRVYACGQYRLQRVGIRVCWGSLSRSSTV